MQDGVCYVLACSCQVIGDTLDLLVESGGKQALAAVKQHIPTYTHFNPQ
jgi:hypothetical protein